MVCPNLSHSLGVEVGEVAFELQIETKKQTNKEMKNRIGQMGIKEPEK
jgi:hypothetical protein